VWGKDATGAANELRKGARVFIQGRFTVDNYVDKEGAERKALEINVDSYGVVPRNVPEPVTVVNSRPIEDPLDDPWSV
jgi:single-stranded DNA-binding protein